MFVRLSHLLRLPLLVLFFRGETPKKRNGPSNKMQGGVWGSHAAYGLPIYIGRGISQGSTRIPPRLTPFRVLFPEIFTDLLN